MPKVPKHMELSKGRTGKTYQELHEWMDPWGENRKLAKEMHEITKIPEHLEYVKEQWGDEGAREFLFHIKEDLENQMSKSLIERAYHKFFG